MYVVDVIPLSRGISKEHLSYFSATKLEPGSAVTISIRNRKVSGIIISSSPAISRKSDIRKAPFALRKASELRPKNVLLPGLIQAAHVTADAHAATTGSILYALGLQKLFNHIPERVSEHTALDTRRHGGRFILQADDDDRFAAYRRFVREEFARRGSVMFIVPTAHEIPFARARLEKGIEAYTHSIGAAHTPRQIGAVYRNVLAERHAVLIVATPQFLHIPRTDIGAIILEHESSRVYKTISRPFLDFRIFSEKLANAFRANIVFGDSMTSVETFSRALEGELIELAPITTRRLTAAECSIVDMKRYRGGPKRITVLSDELKALIENTRSTSKNLFIYAARRGISAITICGDCGTIVVCLNCASPMVLHSGTGGNFFLCHQCGSRRTAEEFCLTCGSWRLVPLGIGVERVHAEIKNLYPDLALFHIDKDVTPSHKKASETAAKFLSSPGSVLVGTEMALAYLPRSIENTAVASIDSLFAVPDFRMHERIFSILLKIRSIASEQLLVQTRNPDEVLIDMALKGNLAEFYRSEMNERKHFLYPPFSVLLRVSVLGRKDIVSKEVADLCKQLHPYRVDIFPTFLGKGGGISEIVALIRIPRDKWPDKGVVDFLRSLPPHYTVNVNPHNLF